MPGLLELVGKLMIAVGKGDYVTASQVGFDLIKILYARAHPADQPAIAARAAALGVTEPLGPGD